MELLQASQAIVVIKSKLIDAGDLQTHDKFKNVLWRFRNREIHSSMVIDAIRNLFQEHPDLLRVLEPFLPATAKGAADLQAGIDFVAGVRDRFSAARCRKILNCISSFLRGELSVSEVREEVLRLLAPHKNLVAAFVAFLPEDSGDVPESSRKRRKSSSNSDEDIVVRERRSKRVVGGNKPDPNMEDFDMEDSLGFLDVQISSIESTYEKAVGLKWLLLGGGTEVRLEEHFSPLNLACIRGIHKELLKSDGENLSSATSELMVRLEKKMESLKKSKAKLVEKWRKIRQSRTMIR